MVPASGCSSILLRVIRAYQPLVRGLACSHAVEHGHHSSCGKSTVAYAAGGLSADFYHTSSIQSERCARWRPFQVRRLGFRDGLHEPAGADAHRYRDPRHPERRRRHDSRHRSGEYVTDCARRRSRRTSDVARCNLRSIHRCRYQRRHWRRRGQPVQQRTRMGRALVDRMERRHRPFATSVDFS